MGYRDDMFNNLVKMLVGIVVFAVLVRTTVNSGLFTPKVYKGRGYVFDIPKGWIESKELSGVTKSEDGKTETDTITYVTPEKDPITDLPVAMISVITIKSPQAIWIEDEFGNILNYIRRAGYRILDTGEGKMDTANARWVLFIDRESTFMTLEYYFVPDSGILHKMVYSVHADKFKKYVRTFEDVRKSFRFVFSLF